MGHRVRLMRLPIRLACVVRTGNLTPHNKRVAMYRLVTSNHSTCSDEFRVPTFPGVFFSNFHDPESPGKLQFKVLESSGIYLWFKLTNMHYMDITPCGNKCIPATC